MASTWLLWIIAAVTPWPASAAGGFVNHYASPSARVGPGAPVLDAAGNVYIAGSFDAPLLGIGAVTLSRIGDHDAFVAKLDPDGNTIWARNFGGAGAYTFGGAIAIDGSGHLFAAGSFGGSDLSVPPRTRIGTEDAFMLKLDSGTGNVLWAENYGGAGVAVGTRAIATDQAGQPYLTAYFFGGALTKPAVSQIGHMDALVMKLGATDGAVSWARGFAATGIGIVAITAMAADATGNLYLTGDFGFGDLVDPAMTKQGYVDTIVLKLSGLNGSTIWARNYHDAFPKGAGASAIAVDPYGHPYLAGSVFTGGFTRYDSSATQGFISRLSERDGTIVWTRTIGLPHGSTGVTSLASDGVGNMYGTGAFSAEDVPAPKLTRIGDYDSFLIKFESTNGTVQWGKNIGGPRAVVWSSAAALDPFGRIFVAGSFGYGTLTMPQVPLIGALDAFVLKLVHVTQNGNGSDGQGTTIMTEPYVAGERVFVPALLPNMVRTGYRFTGWNSLPDGTGTSYLPGATLTIGSNDVVLYAQWEAAIPAEPIPSLSLAAIFLLAVLVMASAERASRMRCNSLRSSAVSATGAQPPCATVDVCK